MQKVGIVTDSTTDLPQELAEALGIKIVPLKVHFGEKVFADGVDLLPGEFYRKLAQCGVLPTTSQPSPGDFVRVYQQLGKEVDSIISVHLSSRFSGTYQAARLAKEMLLEQDIEVIDSRVVHMVLGIVLIRAAEAAKAGKDKDEVLNIIQTLLAQVNVYFMVDTFEYLQRGGRIGKAKALLGSLLNLKPILTLREGIIVPADKARGRNKAYEHIMHLMEASLGRKRKIVASITHAESWEEAEKLKAMVEQNFAVEKCYTGYIGPVVGTHVGPGTVAVAFYPCE